MTVIFDPATDTFSVTTPPSAAGCFSGGALLADGTVLLLPGLNSDLLECRIWDPATDTYTPAPELAAVPAIGQGAYWAGACCRMGGWCLRRGTHGTWWCGSRGWGRSMGGMWRWRVLESAAVRGSSRKRGVFPEGHGQQRHFRCRLPCASADGVSLGVSDSAYEVHGQHILRLVEIGA